MMAPECDARWGCETVDTLCTCELDHERGTPLGVVECVDVGPAKLSPRLADP
ncbi:MAG: hypothetical protein K0V04_21730 [Deltaproteobacteria bacterium]|nr:hypothetical protein [Deltaproteobacteria bacterium]